VLPPAQTPLLAAASAADGLPPSLPLAAAPAAAAAAAAETVYRIQRRGGLSLALPVSRDSVLQFTAGLLKIAGPPPPLRLDAAAAADEGATAAGTGCLPEPGSVLVPLGPAPDAHARSGVVTGLDTNGDVSATGAVADVFPATQATLFDFLRAPVTSDFR